MNHSWNKDIHDRLKDFPKKAPEGLLDDIKSEMLRRGLTPAPAAHKRPAVLFRVASMAAMILVLLGISYLFQWKEPALLPVEKETAVYPDVKDEVLPIPSESTESQPLTPSAPLASRLLAQDNLSIGTQADTLTVQEDSISYQTEKEKEAGETGDTLVEHSQETTSHPESVRRHTRWTYAPQKRKKASYAVGLYFSGLVAQADLSMKKGEMIDAFPPPFQAPEVPDGAGNEEDTTTVASRAVSRSFSRYKGSEKATHHLPVKFGLSFRYYLSEKWNIQSGLTYSYLASDLSYSGPETSYKTKQKLHYIGIPLQVGLRIWEGERFKGYLSAGGQVEKLVSGKATTRYTMKDGVTGTLVENVSDNKPLFSALASIGVEYMLGKDLSLYAEPGIHYYIKNGNGLQTHYNEQPLNINLTIGFRFHWDK